MDDAVVVCMGAAAWYTVLLPYTLYKAHTLNVLNLGSPVAMGLGVRADRERLILLVLAVALAGLGVAAGGGISFLGLVAPHIARRLVGPRHQMLLPTAALLGSLILLLADTIGKKTPCRPPRFPPDWSFPWLAHRILCIC